MRMLNPWFLILAPIALLLIVWRAQKTGTPYTYSITAFVAEFRMRWVMRVIQILLFVVILGIIVGLSRPVVEGSLMPVVTNTRDTVLLIDRSGSMGSPYYRDNDRPNHGVSPQGASKYVLARELAAKYIEARPDDRITAFIFADYIFGLLPLTKKDHDVLSQWLRLPDEVEGGTAIGPAIIVALKHLDEMGQTGERTLIVLSDGEGIWSSEIETEISELLAKTHTKLFWVYIEPAYSIEWRVRHDIWNNSQRGLLRMIAQTGGRRFDAGSPEKLEEALEFIRQLATEPAVIWLPARERDLYPFIVTGSLVLILLTFVGIRVWIR